MQVVQTDIVIVGGGGAGLRAAIAAAECDPKLRISLISKVVPMRSHTVAAEGGSAGVVQSCDSLDSHFHDTVAGGDWLCEQPVVDYFIASCTREMVQLEHWGCPWSRQEDGSINVRNFGGMTTARTWFAADKTGFHILHTLFQTSMKYPSIQRFDEFFCLDLIVDDGRCQGIVAIEIATGEFFRFEAHVVIFATGGAGRIYPCNTNAGISTGDGMGIALRHGVALRDMEFVQYHPTALAGSGLLITEGCRGEGGFLYNKDGYRYLQDYGLGPVDPSPRPKAMELGPRDKLSQAFWHEDRLGRTLDTPLGSVVHLDLRHLGRIRLHERLPMICEMAETFLGIDPAEAPIPVRPAVHYTMGGICTDGNTATSLPGFFAVGECSSVGIHGANRLGSNSLAEIVVFGKVAGEQAAQAARTSRGIDTRAVAHHAESSMEAALALFEHDSDQRIVDLRKAMQAAMEEGVGIYRTEEGMSATCRILDELVETNRRVHLDDKNRVFNTEWLTAIELGFTLDVARTMAYSAIQRKESRGAHQRLDRYEQRDDTNFLKHSLAYAVADAPPRIEYQEVVITKLPPAERVYGGQAKSQLQGE